MVWNEGGRKREGEDGSRSETRTTSLGSRPLDKGLVEKYRENENEDQPKKRKKKKKK